MKRKQKQFRDEDLERVHFGRGWKKGLRAEAKRELKEHRKDLLALLLIFILGWILGALATRKD